MGLGPEESNLTLNINLYLLQLGKIGGYTFRYFSKDKCFTKSHIINELSKIQEAKYYFPDDINPISIGRDYLFTVSDNILKKYF